MIELTQLNKSGFFNIDNLDESIRLEWEIINPHSERFNEVIRNCSSLLVETYTKLELEFARKFPEAVPNEYFLQPLIPLFQDGVEKMDWDLAENEIRDIFQQFFSIADFAKFSSTDDTTIFVLAKETGTDKTLGVIQFISSPAHPEHNIKIGYYGFIPHFEKWGLDKILMSTIFNLAPITKRIFLDTRITNLKTIDNYLAIGFNPFPCTMPHWYNLEYLSDKTTLLQKISEKLSPY